MDIEWHKNNYIHYITKETYRHNLDNISRTNAYQKFYFRYPEIKWSLVASVVSRNAGWNMTDLLLAPFRSLLSYEERSRLFMTYERANWLIFSDAYPQLLIYQLSVQYNKPLFDLLKYFHVSTFMINEWKNFWQNKDQIRLVQALIINEQHVIQSPVIKQSYFKRNVFWQRPYLFQDLIKMNAVILPTKTKALYGCFVHDFTRVSKRIMLGKKIASLLLDVEIYEHLIDFIKTVTHTGSRKDYEKYLGMNFPTSPILRTCYPVITHQDRIRVDWYKRGKLKDNWFDPIYVNKKNITKAFYRKRHLFYTYYHLKQSLSK